VNLRAQKRCVDYHVVTGAITDYIRFGYLSGGHHEPSKNARGSIKSLMFVTKNVKTSMATRAEPSGRMYVRLPAQRTAGH
jgi:hypothetical protein